MKIIHITDTHLVPAGQTLHTLDPAARLKRVLDDVNQTHPDADLVVLTGDLTQDGNPAAYALLKSLLSELSMPVRLLLGNHDARDNFRAAFPDHPVDRHGFIQSMMPVRVPMTGCCSSTAIPPVKSAAGIARRVPPGCAKRWRPARKAR